MQLETKFMRLPMPVTVGSLIGGWQVTWGYWTKHRLSFLVMVVKLPAAGDEARKGFSTEERIVRDLIVM